jgi:hypothetical protein
VRAQTADGGEPCAFTLKKILLNEKDVKSVFRGDCAFFQCEREIKRGQLLYKIGESSSPDPAKFKTLPIKAKTKIDISIEVAENYIEAKINSENIWRKQAALKPALKHPLSNETLEKIFSEANSDTLRAGNVSAQTKGNFFLPLSILKELRREFWKWAETLPLSDSSQKKASTQLKKFIADYKPGADFSEKIENVFMSAPGHQSARENGVNCFRLEDYNPNEIREKDEIILPSFTPEKEIPALHKKIGELLRRGIRRFRLTSISQFELFKGQKNISLAASYPIQSCNSLAAFEFRRLGAEKVQVWCELEKGEIEKLIKMKPPCRLEILRKARIPILFTRGKVRNKICEIRKRRFDVIKEADDIYALYPQDFLSIPETAGTDNFYDTTKISGKQRENSFNYHRQLF